MPQTQQRMYSFQVQGWVWSKGGEKNGLAQATIVAASNAEAIEEAQELLTPDGELTEWAVTSLMELDVPSSKAWAKWHKDATSPLGRAEAEQTAEAADAAVRE